MILGEPIPFAEAVQSRSIKRLLPSSLNSADLSRLSAQLRERAVFSARTTHAGYLQRVNDLVSDIADGTLDQATARLRLKDMLEALSYDPQAGGFPGDQDVPPAAPGSLRDLSSDARLNLILETNVQQAQGYGDWIQSQDPAVLDQWPAQELYRGEARAQERDWPERWAAAGGEFFDGGRMIALKNSPIWVELSAFGLPYPPFDFNSGMWVRDIDRAEAEDLGLIGPDEQVDPQTRDFAEDTEASAAQFDGWLQQALEDAGDYRLGADGVLRLDNRAPASRLLNRLARYARLLLNAGTGDGARKGWITRRGGMAQAPATLSLDEADKILQQGVSEVSVTGSTVNFGMRLKQKLESKPEYVERKKYLPWARETVKSGTHVTSFENGEKRDYYGKMFQEAGEEKGLMVIVSVKDGEAFNMFRAPKKYLQKKGLTNRRGDDPERQPSVTLQELIAAAGQLMELETL